MSIGTLTVSCAVLLAACGAGEPGPGIDAMAAMAHVQALTALGPRGGDTPASAAAAAYIRAQVPGVVSFEVGTVDLPAIELPGLRVREAHRARTVDPDLIVHFGPAGPPLLVMAHYDTVPGSPGAVDNAAAVAVLIELARVLRAHPPRAPVELAFTANEEIGLVGSTVLAAREPPPAFAIALDLIGGDGPLSINGASTLIRASELGWLAEAAERAGVRLDAPIPHRVMSRWFPQAERSDHGPFTARGIRAIHLYDRGRGADRVDVAYHTPADTADRVSPGALDELGRLLVALAARPPPARDPDDDAGFWLPVATNTVVPRIALVVGEIVLALAALAGLALLVRRPDPTPRRAGLGAGVACYAVAVAVTAGIERLAAGAHPAPWLHAPLRAELALVLVGAGVLGLVTRLVGRWWPWCGEQRYLAMSIALQLVVGVALLVAGAAELAWLALMPAVTTAAAPRLGRGGLVGVAGSLVAVAIVLAPAQLREVAFNLPLPRIPLAAYIGLLASPFVLGVTWRSRRRSRSAVPAPGPLGAVVLPVGCGLAIATGVTLLFSAHPMCSAAEFNQFHLGCERPRDVH